MATSITSANAIFTISASPVFSSPQQLQGFAADDIFDTGILTVTEVLMGVDGKLSAGLVYVPVEQTISLQADSSSNVVFESIVAAMKQQNDVYFLTGNVMLTGLSGGATTTSLTQTNLNSVWVLNRGVITKYPPIPDAKRVLQPRRYTVVWESVVGQPTASAA